MVDIPEKVADGQVVSIDYILRLSDGQEIDRSESGFPLQFVQGRGQIIRGLESKLYGMAIGEQKQVTVAPSDGYGEFDPEDFADVQRDAFPQDFDLNEGEDVQVQDPDSGQVKTAFVSEIGPDEVKLDFNHPLAGETLHYEVTVAALRMPTEEELAHGHVHGPGNAH
jgi:FKBP-type peptidyl-prolyl cis-trans isomerase SlyD